MFQGKEVILIFNLSIAFCVLVSRSSAALFFYKINFVKQNEPRHEISNNVAF